MKFELIIKNAINNSPIEKESQSELLISENERISCPYLELSTKKKEKKTNSSRSTKLRMNFIFVLITASKSLGHSFVVIKYLSQLDISIHVKNITVTFVGRHHSNWNVIVIFSDTKLSIGESWNNIVDQRSKNRILVLVRSQTWITDWKLGHVGRTSTIEKLECRTSFAFWCGVIAEDELSKRTHFWPGSRALEIICQRIVARVAIDSFQSVLSLQTIFFSFSF